MMNTEVKKAVIALHLDKEGLLKNFEGSHSLRAGRVMAMHPNGIYHNTIKRMIH